MLLRHRLFFSLLFIALMGVATLASCSALPRAQETAPAAAAESPMAGLKDYGVAQSAQLHATSLELQSAAAAYHELARAANFDYAALWNGQPEAALDSLRRARAAFLAANPQYEQMEGVVAGVPSLRPYDVILDAGTAAAEGGEDIVPFDLTLPDGRVLAKPGNLFALLEAALWGTEPAYSIPGIQPDYNANQIADFGETLPDAAVLLGAADAFERYTRELSASIQAWQPTQAEAFGALVANVPTFNSFMESWKNSRFVSGAAAPEKGFVATSRLADLSDNILSWQKIYASLSPAVRAKAPDADTQITRELDSLQEYVSDLYDQETNQGKRFQPEEVDLLNEEGQRRAVAVAGQITQAAALLGVSIEVE